MSAHQTVIAGVSRIASRRIGLPPRELARKAIASALADASARSGLDFDTSDIRAIFASPSFAGAVPPSDAAPVSASPFLGAHGIATHVGLFDG